MPDPIQRAPAIKGRGVAGNPANRFTQIEHVPDPEFLESESPRPTTEFLCDTSRTVISTNDSPDVGFTASLNPYRGCEHGCAYCLSGDTLILMADGTTKRLEDICIGDSIYGTIRRGWYRRYVKTRVLAHWRTIKPAMLIVLGDGTELIASGDHRFLTERGWKFVSGRHRPHLTINNKLMGIGRFVPPAPLQKDEEYKRGYCCGLIRGDGHLAFYPYKRAGRSHGHQYQFRLALADDEALQRAREYLSEFGVATHAFRFQEPLNGRKGMQAIRTHARGHVDRINKIVAWPAFPSADWRKGFLGGIFDAEGSFSGGNLRITNTDQTIIDQTVRCLRGLAFEVVVETRARETPTYNVRLRGGLREHFRFFHNVDPAISRKRNIESGAVKSEADLRVASVEPLGVTLPLYDITTGTGDFIANGVVSHNCYARPTHEYLGYSAGLDFETKIMVKEQAAALLRQELSDPKWRPQVLAMSGVTDPYQPIEREREITRRCLKVLAEFRNPVGIVTKNALVTRDIDLLSELAKYDAVAVFISVTTLDPALCGVLEPRTSRPAKRLEALRRLTDAGIPAAVMVAPVIPGLTDHEIPAIIAAAAKAGARRAGMVMLRLPHAVKDLFEAWLEHHVPEKKTKVLNRIRAIRGGRLNDPRFGSRMEGEGVFAEQIAALFRLACKKAGFSPDGPRLSTAHFRRPQGPQLSLF